MHLIFKTAVMVYFKTPPSTEEKIEGKVKVTGRRGKRRKQILDEFNPLNAELNPICHLLALLGAHHILHISRIRVREKRGFWKWEGEALDRTVWRTRFGRDYGFVVRETVDDLKGKNGLWKLKGEELDRTLWRIGKGYGFVVRQTAV
jgi:hypothetical protein